MEKGKSGSDMYRSNAGSSSSGISSSGSSSETKKSGMSEEKKKKKKKRKIVARERPSERSSVYRGVTRWVDLIGLADFSIPFNMVFWIFIFSIFPDTAGLEGMRHIYGIRTAGTCHRARKEDRVSCPLCFFFSGTIYFFLLLPNLTEILFSSMWNPNGKQSILVCCYR